jgi:hypothetical protein
VNQVIAVAPSSVLPFAPVSCATVSSGSEVGGTLSVGGGASSRGSLLRRRAVSSPWPLGTGSPRAAVRQRLRRRVRRAVCRLADHATPPAGIRTGMTAARKPTHTGGRHLESDTRRDPCNATEQNTPQPPLQPYQAPRRVVCQRGR